MPVAERNRPVAEHNRPVPALARTEHSKADSKQAGHKSLDGGNAFPRTRSIPTWSVV